jgi:hypothetical protein
MKDDEIAEWLSADASETGEDDPRLVAAMREYLAAAEAGRPPARQEFLAQHAAIAAELSDCLDGLELVHAATRKPLSTKAAPPVAPRPKQPVKLDQSQQPLGDFRIGREIGRGGMGVVYEAYQLSLGRRVALKVLPFAASLDPSRLERFKHEAQAAAQLHHTNIVPVYSVGIERGVHFYAMQLIEGQSLSVSIHHLRQATGRPTGRELASTTPALATNVVPGHASGAANKQQPTSASAAKSALKSATNAASASKSFDLGKPASADPSVNALAETVGAASTVLTDSHANPTSYFHTVARLMQQAAVALEHAHAMGVIHRDIKPGNLLLDTRGNLWVTDFGLAQFQADVQLTRTGDLLGTLRYMSPEQAEGGRVLLDHRTDVYSLGATMYELLTLEPVFPSTDRNVLLRQIMQDEPRPPAAVNKKIPVELETIVLKAIAKSPTDRYASAEQLADDLQRWLEDKPILARRPRLAERAARWCRRHQSIVKVAAVFLCLAVLGLVAGTIVIAHEHANTETAFQSEIKQRAAAQESFRQARQAIDTFTQFSEDELASKPLLHQLRRKLLETSLAYYKSFIEQRHDDPTLSKELEATSQRVAHLLDELALEDELAPLALLASPSVQRELAIPAEDREQIEDQLGQLWAEREKSRSPNRQTQSADQSSVTESLRSHGEKLFSLLSADQLRRLKQIAWQQQGARAFNSPDVAAALKLTHEQRQQISVALAEPPPPRPPERREFDRDHGPREAIGRESPNPRDFRPDSPRHDGPRSDGSGRDGPGDNGPPFHGPAHHGPGRGPGDGGFGPDDLGNHGPGEGPGRGGPGRDAPERRGPGQGPRPDDPRVLDPSFDRPQPEPIATLQGDPRPPVSDETPGNSSPGPRRRGPPEGRPPREPPGRARAEEAALSKILETLTPPQRAAWSDLIGKPFDFRRTGQIEP